MPQLSPLFWLMYLIVSLIPLMFGILVSEGIWSEVVSLASSGKEDMNFKW